MELESVLHADEEDQASDIIKLLLMRGVDPNTRAWSDFNHLFGSHSFSTPLQNAVVHRRPVCLNLLLSHGADPNFAGWPSQWRAIEVAIGHQSPDLVNALLYHGTTKYTPPWDDDTFNILTHPAATAHLPTWHECLSHFDLTNADTPDYTAAYAALLHAARHAHPDLITFLIACGVGIHGQWNPPLLPLPDAAAAATPDLPRHTCLARPAIDAALEAGDQAMVDFLLVRGAGRVGGRCG